jgi:hypothetical protein
MVALGELNAAVHSGEFSDPGRSLLEIG